MSHALQLKNVKLDVASVQKMLAANPEKFEDWTVQTGKHYYYDGTGAEGLLIQPPMWKHPITIKNDGSLVYDLYGGSWGKADDLSDLVAAALGFQAGYSVASMQIEETPEGQRLYEFA